MKITDIKVGNCYRLDGNILLSIYPTIDQLEFAINFQSRHKHLSDFNQKLVKKVKAEMKIKSFEAAWTFLYYYVLRATLRKLLNDPKYELLTASKFKVIDLIEKNENIVYVKVQGKHIQEIGWAVLNDSEDQDLLERFIET